MEVLHWVNETDARGIFINEMPWLDTPGNYNNLPEPCTKVTQEEFFHWRDMYGPKYTEFRQIIIGECYRNIHIEWFHDRGYGWFIKRDRNPKYTSLKDLYVEKIVFLRFGCLHEYQELSQKQCKEEGITHWGMCWHVERCSKCGKTQSFDSSD